MAATLYLKSIVGVQRDFVSLGDFEPEGQRQFYRLSDALDLHARLALGKTMRLREPGERLTEGTIRELDGFSRGTDRRPGRRRLWIWRYYTLGRDRVWEVLGRIELTPGGSRELAAELDAASRVLNRRDVFVVADVHGKAVAA